MTVRERMMIPIIATAAMGGQLGMKTGASFSKCSHLVLFPF
ncbi:hypothetical protein [Geobacillus kaustophilus]|nr:hypothetical protein [Geobacillus kaustophilus]